MTIRRIAVVVFALSALAVSECTSSAPLPSGSPSASNPARPGPTPTASAAASTRTVNIPADCRKLVDPQTYAATFGNTPLNDPAVIAPEAAGAVQPKASSAAASVQQVLDDATQLRCVWRDPGADITYLQTTIATVDASIAKQYLDSLPASGYTCIDANGGRQCQRVQPDPQYPVDNAHTAYLRDNVYIDVGQANFPTHNLMGSIVATIWG
jgi:hypothetical protein